MEGWHYWLIGGIFFVSLEIFIFAPEFFVASLALGCFGASVAAFADSSLTAQLFVFSVVTIMSVFAVRPFFKKYIFRFDDPKKTGVAAMVGRMVKVTETIDSAEGLGRVQVDGESWQARSDADEKIEAGAMVRIKRVNSVILFVEKQ